MRAASALSEKQRTVALFRLLQVGSLVLPALVTALIGFQAWRTERARAVEASQKNAALVQQYTSRIIETQSFILDWINALIPDDLLAQGDRRQMHEMLVGLQRDLEFVVNFGVIDSKGTLVASSRIFPIEQDVTTRDYFIAIKSGAQSMTIDRVTLRPSQREAVVIAKRRPGPVFNGIVVSAVPVETFTTFFAQIAQLEGAAASLLRSDGKLLVRHFPQAPPIMLPPTAPAMQAIAGQRDGTYEALAISDRVNRIYAFTQVGSLPVFASYGFATRTIWHAWLWAVGPTALLLNLAGLFGFVAMWQAIRREAAEAEQRRADQLYRAFFTNISDSLFVIGVQPDRLTLEDANPAHGRSSQQFSAAHRGKPLGEVCPPPTAEKLEAYCRRCIEANEPIRFEEELDFGVGPRRWETVLAPVLDGAGTVTHLVGASRDITDRTELEEALRQSQRMEAVGQLTGGIAHDFNNLLTVVIGNLDMLRRAKADRAPRLIENALTAAEQGRRLTSQLLAFSRRQPLKPEVVDLKSLLGGMTDMLTQSLRGDIEFEIDLAENLWPVEVDPAQLQAALINLAANARDAMPKGGLFRITARNAVAQDGTAVESIALEISDTGIGISPEALPRVFEPFFTTKPVGRGTGLGLAQVYGFVQQSGGSVDIRSEVARGTTVTLRLPRSGSAASANFVPPQRGPAPARTGRILLVDDNAEVAEVAANLLQEQGHSIVRAASGPEALEVLLRDGRFDLVFSDLVMPGGLDGLDLAREIRSRWPGLPVLLATGYSEAAVRARDENFPLLSKPYEPAVLLGTVGEMLSQPAPAATVIPLRPRGS